MKQFDFIKGLFFALLLICAVQVKAQTYTVSEAIAVYNAGGAKTATVNGYIVGVLNGSKDKPEFKAETTVNTNLLLADNADETDVAKCLAVQLPSGEVRNALNLAANPGNYKKCVALTGSIEKYFTIAGLKNVKEYSFDAAPEQPETPVVPAGEYINEAFTNGFGSFTTQEIVGSYPWVSDKTYGAKASGYADGASQDAESWLISSAMNFSKETAAYIAFDYVINKGDVSAAASNHQLLITSNYTGDVATTEWTEVDFGAVNNGNWTFQNTGEIALPESMMGKAAVVIAFKYVSTTANSSTWEVKNVVVTSGTGNTPEQPEQPEQPEEPETPETLECTVAEAIAAFVAGETKPAIVKGYIVGTINGQVYTEGCVFSGTAESKTNLLLADNPDETDYNNCMPVQLPSGAVRDALNLVDHPENYGHQVALTGSIEKYFGVAGLKNVKEYSFVGDAPEQPEQPEQPEEPETPEQPEQPETPETPEIVVGENILLNSGFEDWNDGALTAWGKDGSNATAHSATIAQSTDADSGIYAVEVAGATGNKRLASKAYTLPAGTYTLSAFIKQSGDAVGAFRLGYAVIKDGAIANSDYKYLNEATYVTEEWEYYGVEFTLEEVTTVSVLVMNSKVGNGASILVDDVELVALNTTAVEVTVEDCDAVSVYYDLSGRVVKNPANGIYICNGKKVLVK